MKKIISYFLLVALVINILAINVFAEGETIMAIAATIEQDDSDDGHVYIKITSPAETDLMIKILDTEKKDKIVYLKALLAQENSGVYNIKLSKPDLGYRNFKLIVSASGQGVEKSFSVSKKNGGNIGGGGGGGGDSGSNTQTLENQEGQQKDNLLESTSKVTTLSAATKAIDKMAKGVTAETKALSDTSENAALVTTAMSRNLGAKNVKISGGNSLSITESIINASDLAKVENTVKSIMDAVNKNGYTYNREIERELILKVKFDQTKKATIIISESVIDALKGIDILTILDEDFQISFRVEDLKKELAEMEEGQDFEIYLERVEIEDTEEKIAAANMDFLSAEDYRYIALATKKTAKKVSFNKTKLASNVNVSVPSQNKTNTQFQTIKNVEENSLVGGKYNAATGMIEAEIGAGGTYIVEENQVNFTDIEQKSAAMQEAIRVLAAKGIIDGMGDGSFSPDAALSRAEFAKLLVKTLYANGTGAGFTDTSGKWYESYAKAARGAGIISGFEDGSFRGDNTILKEQITAIAARTLREKKKYYNPTDPEKYLSSFTDRANISAWAATDISLASRENLIILRTDGTFRGKQNMTRGEAALVLKKLFDRL